MKDFFKLKSWFIALLMLAISFSLSAVIVFFEFSGKMNIKTTYASSGDNVSGWAWNSNIGWISFNCTNESPACSGTNYGVKLDLDTGNFSGYAWSSSVGWISFNETAPDYAFNSGCNVASSCSASGCTACYNFNDNKIYGWAKILSMGSDGWIKLRKSPADIGPDYGVSIEPASGDFSGWAWNAYQDGTGIGWTSFNCSTDGSCSADVDYKVSGIINRPPTVTNMSASNWNFVQAAESGALKANLAWQFNDADNNPEAAYQIIVNTSNSTSNALFDSGRCTAYTSSGPCKIDIGVDRFPIHLATSLNYNTKYYWWVKVWDNSQASALTQYNFSPDTDNDDGDPLTFTTYKHEMPAVDFTWFPQDPSKDSEAKFTDKSQVYLSSTPSTSVPCDESRCSWLWTATGDVDIVSPTASSTKIKFNSSGSVIVTLKVTENYEDHYYISVSKSINVSAKLPKWIEVKPE